MVLFPAAPKFNLLNRQSHGHADENSETTVFPRRNATVEQGGKELKINKKPVFPFEGLISHLSLQPLRAQGASCDGLYPIMNPLKVFP